ncbi:MAG TPA: alkaline phosphatase family protein [Phycisphaerales bacterium]|nr:alkaline phosphatase family protein [Phycisphaerales bacterium]HMP36063.1 alkaline phosphatase family protein [Phycisphaerales bacterium]
MAARHVVLNVVGLSMGLLPRMQRLGAWASRRSVHAVAPMLPGLTTSVQATYTTGLDPSGHGIVANGWYDRALAEVHFWKQSNHLVGGEKLWDLLRRADPNATGPAVANLFWWYAMYSGADITVTPRPCYPADGRKIPDLWTNPSDLRDELQRRFGPFPLFRFWGPAASIESTRWIAAAALHVVERRGPRLTLVYLPHLDYPLQKLGPDHPAIDAELVALDGLLGEMIETLESSGCAVTVLSEYGIEPVDGAVAVNEALRSAGFLAIRTELGRELLDAGASRAFAVADHQIAHVYVRDPRDLDAVVGGLAGVPGIAMILDRRLAPGAEDGLRRSLAGAGLDHARSGDLVLVAARRRWFSYRWWSDDRLAPDYARTVDIHRKPGYDPLELFIDPALRMPRLRIAWTLLRRRLGFRALMEVIPLDPALVRGSHGRIPEDPSLFPVLITRSRHGDAPVPATAIRDLILAETLSAMA